MPAEHEYSELREKMLLIIAAHAAATAEITGRPVLNELVIDAMKQVPRHLFVPEVLRTLAYSDSPLPIGHDKTISQPFIVALMCDLLEIEKTDRVLEVGTGLGYQAAVLSRLAAEVYTIDIINELASEATQILHSLHYDNVKVRVGNGALGWDEAAPFDKIIIAASADEIPPKLVKQLSPGGLLVMPKGTPDSQKLILLQKGIATNIEDEILAVQFSRLVIPH